MDDAALKERIKQLAATLRATGIAASPARAEEMASDIVATEQKQLRRHEEKKFDPAINPQQRVGGQGAAPITTGSVGVGVSQSTPIAEMFENEDDLEEEAIREVEQELAQPAPEPMAQPAPVTQPEPIAQFTPAADAQPAPALEPEDDSEEISFEEAEHTIAAPEPPGAPEPEVPEDNTFEEPAPATPDPIAAPEPEPVAEPEAPKKEGPKVDLSEMFNFAKRK